MRARAPAIDWERVADRVLGGAPPSREEALAVLAAPDEELLPILAACRRVRETHHGKRVKVHILLSAKSGLCPEGCTFCSQSVFSTTQIEKHPLVSKEVILERAREAEAAGAWKFCIATATRSPSDADLEDLCDAIGEIKRTTRLRVCASLGFLDKEKARRLKEAGVDKFNHNIETSERFFPRICTTHSWRDRLDTIRIAREAGMAVCSGGIVGMGETDEDVVDMAFTLRELEVESIPVNFLDPRPGTPLADRSRLTPARCLRTLAMFRFVNPERDIRAAAGREGSLRSLQPLALYVVSSIFTDGYLTTPGNEISADLQMIVDIGYEVLAD